MSQLINRHVCLWTVGFECWTVQFREGLRSETSASPSCRSVTDPRDGRKVALKKMPNVFQNLVSCKRVFRELRMLCFFKHDNVRRGWHRVGFNILKKKNIWEFVFFSLSSQVLSALDILQPPQIDCFEEMYPCLWETEVHWDKSGK